MRCPRCGEDNDKVIESRSLAQGTSVRRRRECNNCGYRFTSYERLEERTVMVIKSNGRREPYSREKVERGLRRALEKRAVAEEAIEQLLNEIEDEAAFHARTSHEISSRRIGDLVLSRLYDTDRVAYVRFASVYRNFNDIMEFVQTIQDLEAREGAEQ